MATKLIISHFYSDFFILYSIIIHMNQIEFNEVINYFKYDSKTNIHFRNKLVDVFKYKDVTVLFGGSYYAAINGRIPYYVGKSLEEKYDNSIYHIRVDGGGDDWKLDDHIVDDKYLDDMKSFSPSKYPQIKESFIKRDNKDKFLPCYHIDTIEGLIAFFIEYLDIKYDYNDVYRDISNNLFNKYQQTTNNNQYSAGYYATINDEKNNRFRVELRELINRFDSLISPFNKDFDILFNSFKLKYDPDGIKIIIDNNELFCSINSNNFSYRINYMINPDSSYFFSHYFEDGSEKFVISYQSKEKNDDYHMFYDLTKNNIMRRPYSDNEILTDNDLMFLIEELKNGIYILENIIYQGNKRLIKCCNK